ncbi:hypothetical protein LXM94_11835 [Rhizobium sp. TRM95111]|uniref:hypothetical protein n=1 Tax=Rhizobium alarense TaxID=2846851 RepID=UPI001F28D969|nr:hypothetical protein [Rhizobium alarense]MCF3640655.1 hypothetical protein [Rhizobium alarense]
MTVSSMELKVDAIRSDASISDDEKIARLTKLRVEARGLQRAATESAMVDDDGWYEDVHLVDLALAELDAPVEEKGPATL